MPGVFLSLVANFSWENGYQLLKIAWDTMVRRNTLRLAVTATAAGTAVATGSLKDIKHVVLFMQENRAFDHYYGTMAGVRNFADPNAHVDQNGRTTFQQPIEPQNGTDILQPWYINYLGGDYKQSTQCMSSGANFWNEMHTAYADGEGNNWVNADGANSMAYFTRDDLPTHWDIVEGWTVLDTNFQSVLAATSPNRVWWSSGTVNAPGSPSNPNGDGSIIIDNNKTPGCEAPHVNCYPLDWKTFPEYLEDAGVSWQLWQNLDNFEDNPLPYFKQYQNAANGSALRSKGNSYLGLQAFFDAAGNGTLPEISYVVGPQELSEHFPNRPVDGAWLQKKVVDAITNSPAYNETVLIISYDEQGGWADYVPPVTAPNGTAGEWIEDPFGELGIVPVGPGPRVPRYVISPYTRGGNVFTEMSDHSSDIMFIEEWAAAHGYSGVYSEELGEWRRSNMTNMLNAFDWKNPDFSIPSITAVDEPEKKPYNESNWVHDSPLGSLTGSWVGPAKCLSEYSKPAPPVPYGPENANQNLTLLVEQGFKPVRGKLTEGRFLTFELSGLALSNQGKVSVTESNEKHDDIRQRWFIETVGGPNASDNFYLRSAVGKAYVAKDGDLSDKEENALQFSFDYEQNGATYTMSVTGGGDETDFSSIVGCKDHSGCDDWKGDSVNVSIFSVSYH